MKAPPTGEDWAHELKYDGFRFHARLDRGKVKLLTRTGLDWTDKYESAAEAVGKLRARTAYIDGELCAVNPDGTTSFAELQAATDSKSTTHLVYFAFDLLYLNGENLTTLTPLRLLLLLTWPCGRKCLPYFALSPLRTTAEIRAGSQAA